MDGPRSKLGTIVTATSSSSIVCKKDPRKLKPFKVNKYKARERIIKVNPDKREIKTRPYNIFEHGINITPKNLNDSEFTSREGGVLNFTKSHQPQLPNTGGRSNLLEAKSMDYATSSRSTSSLTYSTSRYSIRRSNTTSQQSVNYSLSSIDGFSRDQISFVAAIEVSDQEDEMILSKAPSMFRLREDPPPQKRKEETNFKINLVETETMFFLQLPTESDMLETDNGKQICESNSTYEKSLEKTKAVTSIAVQTTKSIKKHKKSYKSRNDRRNAGAFASVWDMYDTYESLRPNKQEDQAITNTREEGKVDTIAVYDEEAEYESYFEFCGYRFNKRFLNALMVVERIITRNIHCKQQLLYQGLLVQDPFSKDVQFNYTLTHLWTFYCERVKNRPVTSMSCNPKNKNVIAVGYGKFKFSTKCDGLVCVWNVKNPSVPERQYEFPGDPVTFVTFSRFRWHILAVTFYSGSVILIDTVSRSLVVKANNHHYPLYYPVKQARWFSSEIKATVIITCGKGGKIFRYKKSEFFLSNKIMSLGRPHGNIHGVEQPRRCFARKVLTSRQPAAEVLVQHPDDPQVYLVGSAEGFVYICSVQHRHDYKDIFVAHNGPVYNIQFNPFCSKVFLTCGADYCIRIWAESVFEPLITLESGLTAVQDALWSPLHSTIIISTTGTFVEVWDIRRRISKPMSSSHTPSKSYNTVLMFSGNQFNICVGDAEGDVHVMAMSEMPFSPTYQEKVLIDSVYSALITKPEIIQTLIKVGPPFVTGRQINKKTKLNNKLNMLYEFTTST